MEDAYNDLYREFILLRSTCIQQAALLQKLSGELHKLQGLNGVTTFPALLFEDMGKLSLNVPHQRKTNKEEGGGESPQLAPPAVSSAAFYKALQSGESRATQPYGMANQLDSFLSCSACQMANQLDSFEDSEVLLPSGGAFTSEMELQSRECEFCHAVFPGDTATRGEILRHLDTHIT